MPYYSDVVPPDLFCKHSQHPVHATLSTVIRRLPRGTLHRTDRGNCNDASPDRSDAVFKATANENQQSGGTVASSGSGDESIPAALGHAWAEGLG